MLFQTIGSLISIAGPGSLAATELGDSVMAADPDDTERENPSSERKQKPSGTQPELYAITFDAGTGEVVKIERIDANGVRRDLSESDRTRLAAEKNEGRLGGIIEQAFEAGIACVLGGRADLDDERESEEEAELRRLLLRQLIEHSPAARYMQRDVMSRAALRTLIQANLARLPRRTTH
jgi:hypothetical protein